MSIYSNSRISFTFEGLKIVYIENEYIYIKHKEEPSHEIDCETKENAIEVYNDIILKWKRYINE